MSNPRDDTPFEESEVIKALRKGKGGLDFATLAGRMKVFNGHQTALQQVLHAMLQDKKIVYVEGGRYGLPGKRNDHRAERANSRRRFNEAAGRRSAAAQFRHFFGAAYRGCS